MIIAMLILLPETVAALRAAERDRMQISLNLAFGSAMASIGLTIPTIAVASLWLPGPLHLGLDGDHIVLLALTCLVTVPDRGAGARHPVAGRRASRAACCLPVPHRQSMRRARDIEPHDATSYVALYRRKSRLIFTMNARLFSEGKLRVNVLRSSLYTTNSSLPGWYSHLNRALVETAPIPELN